MYGLHRFMERRGASGEAHIAGASDPFGAKFFWVRHAMGPDTITASSLD